MEISTVKNHYEKSLRSWIYFDFGLPVFLIIIIWPICQFLIGLEHSFERVFSTADLIPIGSVLMLATSREIDIENRLNRISRDMDGFQQAGLFIPIITLIVYIVLKYYCLTFSFPAAGSTVELDATMKALPYLSFVIIFCSFTFCFAAKRMVIASLVEEASHA